MKTVVPIQDQQVAKQQFDLNNVKKQVALTEMEEMRKQIALLQESIKAQLAIKNRLYNENEDLQPKFNFTQVGKYYQTEQSWGGRTYRFFVKCLDNTMYIDSDWPKDPIVGQGQIVSISEGAPWKAGDIIDMYFYSTSNQPYDIEEKTEIKFIQA